MVLNNNVKAIIRSTFISLGYICIDIKDSDIQSMQIRDSAKNAFVVYNNGQILIQNFSQKNIKALSIVNSEIKAFFDYRARNIDKILGDDCTEFECDYETT